MLCQWLINIVLNCVEIDLILSYRIRGWMDFQSQMMDSVVILRIVGKSQRFDISGGENSFYFWCICEYLFYTIFLLQAEVTCNLTRWADISHLHPKEILRISFLIKPKTKKKRKEIPEHSIQPLCFFYNLQIINFICEIICFYKIFIFRNAKTIKEIWQITQMMPPYYYFYYTFTLT